ncbi:MAG: SRPBCC domain-containing protein [Firmicutes bacterium]|jgi:carbon monoxide dehydrogenase subunit G|nr:SRPBCC domain-containing protein [Bacillota bacterium]MCL5971236.1 SRPBCC domain-containing protein [Bacillota bacterium]
MKSYQGELQLEAPLETVWKFVTDPNRIGASMPDLVAYTVQDPHHLMAKVRAGVGPVRAVLDMAIELNGDVAARTAQMTVQGSGMGNGVQMQTTMSLTAPNDQEPDTALHWQASVTVSGALAALGSRVLDNQVKKITEKVFENIRQGIAESVTI